MLSAGAALVRHEVQTISLRAPLSGVPLGRSQTPA